MNSIDLGKFIASLRNEKHITQEELAEILFIDKKKVSRWECGTSTPEFEMLIKLTKIFDVSLYELSICKRIKTDKLGKRIINKFKNIKDYHKYRLKIIISITITIALLLFFTFTTVYTFKNINTIKIYDLNSTSNDYIIEGNYFVTPNYSSLNIYKISNVKNGISKQIIFDNECEYGIYKDDRRIILFDNRNNYYFNSIIENNILFNESEKYLFQINCPQNRNSNNHSINFEINNIYNNNLF